MELVLYLVIMTLISIGSFWLAGCLYGLIRTPKIYFPITLASKMAVAAVFGGFFFMIGGPIIATLIFNAEMKKRHDYTSPLPNLAIGAIISVFCSALIYYSIFAVAWQVFD